MESVSDIRNLIDQSFSQGVRKVAAIKQAVNSSILYKLPKSNGFFCLLSRKFGSGRAVPANICGSAAGQLARQSSTSSLAKAGKDQRSA